MITLKKGQIYYRIGCYEKIFKATRNVVIEKVKLLKYFNKEKSLVDRLEVIYGHRRNNGVYVRSCELTNSLKMAKCEIIKFMIGDIDIVEFNVQGESYS